MCGGARSSTAVFTCCSGAPSSTCSQGSGGKGSPPPVQVRNGMSQAKPDPASGDFHVIYDVSQLSPGLGCLGLHEKRGKRRQPSLSRFRSQQGSLRDLSPAGGRRGESGSRVPKATDAAPGFKAPAVKIREPLGSCRGECTRGALGPIKGCRRRETVQPMTTARLSRQVSQRPKQGWAPQIPAGGPEGGSTQRLRLCGYWIMMPLASTLHEEFARLGGHGKAASGNEHDGRCSSIYGLRDV